MEESSLLAGEPGGRRLSAAGVRKLTFPSAMLGGYNVAAVTAFQSTVAAELEARDTEQRELVAEISRLGQEVTQLRQPSNGHATEPLRRVEDQALAVLTRAQQNADRLVADAQVQAREMMGNGRRQRESMLEDGRVKATRIIEEAVDEAGREAARIAAQAPVNAQRQLAYYRSLADTVRASLSANLAALAAQVERWEAEERSGSAAMAGTGPQPARPLA
jgi:cell division septum initiation protein DivIVA